MEIHGVLHGGVSGRSPGHSQDLYEAASIDGATGFKKFRYITIPMLTPTTFFVVIMMTIQCFKVFDLVYVMTGGGPGNSTKTLVNYIYEKAFTSWELGPASAGAIVLFAVVLVITLIQFRGERNGPETCKREEERWKETESNKIFYTYC